MCIRDRRNIDLSDFPIPRIFPAEIDGGSTGASFTIAGGNDFFIGSCFLLGENIVELIAFDITGQISDTCEARITVFDVTPRVLECQDLVVQLDANGIGLAEARDAITDFNRFCGQGEFTTPRFAIFDCNDIGANNTVVYSRTTPEGGALTCESTITVVGLSLIHI